MKKILSHIADTRFGVNAKALDKGPMALVQSSALLSGGIVDLGLLRRIAPEVVNYKPEDLLRKDDVLLIGKGSDNHAAVWPGSDEDTLASSMLYVIRPDPNVIIPAFLVSYLNSHAAKAYFNFHQKAGTVKVLGRMALDELPVPLPSLAEQRTVAQLATAVQHSRSLLNELSQAHATMLNSVWAKFDRA
jgi:hypothetical protein